MTGRPVIIVGNLTIDDVIQPDGSSQMGTLGGNTVHAAAAALTWTGEVGVVVRCGADFPAAALARLREAGADTAGLRPIDGPTVRNWVIYEADGTRTWVYRTPRGRSAEVAPRPDDVPAGWLDRTPPPVVHVAAMPLAAAAALVRSVRERAPQAVITLDTHEDWPRGPEVLGVARLADVFVPSRDELSTLVGYDDPARAAAELVTGGVRCVVVKLGGDGALVARPGSPPARVPAAAVEVVDPTGAGDSFCGGFAAGLALGEDPAAAARRGCATAAAAIGAAGSLRLLERGQIARDLLAGGQGAAQARPGRVPTTSPDQDDYGIETMDREIATIPDVIAAGFADPGGHVRELAGWLADRGIEHLYLTGCGDSAFAGQAATLAFRRHSRLRVHPVHALDFARYDVRYLPPASAVLAISYSGQAGRTIEAAKQAAAFGVPVIALTGRPAGERRGPLAAAAGRILPVDVPTLGFSPGTSTYIGMLCTLIELARQTSPAGGADVLRDACEQLAGQAAKTLDWCQDTAADLAARMRRGRFVTFLGAGPNEATARFGAAKLFEASQQIALATNVEEWAHEEYFITRPGDPVVVIAPAGAARDRAWEILSELEFIRADATVVSDVEPPDRAGFLRLAAGAPEELSPVLAALPLAQLGFHLARQAGKRSYNFPSEQAKDEHYATIHRATMGEPGMTVQKPTGRQPLADIAAEARQVLDGCAAHQVSARLIGGLAVAQHQHLATPPELRRSYADIDIVIGRKEGRGTKAALTELGYEPNERFNALRGDRRMLFYDTANGRQIDVFVGTFAMCHTLDLSGRLTLVPDTLSPADLVLTKLQIVEINSKDLVDAAQLLRNHRLGRGDEAGRDEVSLDRLAAVTSADWGWHTTLSDNLAKLAGFARDALAEPDAAAVTERAEAIQRAIDEPGKSLRWKARARIGRHAPWYELPEEVTGNPHG